MPLDQLKDLRGLVGDRQSALIPQDVKGIFSSSWVSLGQDLWEKGITLGLEKLVLDQHEDSQGESTCHVSGQDSHEQQQSRSSRGGSCEVPSASHTSPSATVGASEQWSFRGSGRLEEQRREPEAESSPGWSDELDLNTCLADHQSVREKPSRGETDRGSFLPDLNSPAPDSATEGEAQGRGCLDVRGRRHLHFDLNLSGQEQEQECLAGSRPAVTMPGLQGGSFPSARSVNTSSAPSGQSNSEVKAEFPFVQAHELISPTVPRNIFTDSTGRNGMKDPLEAKDFAAESAALFSTKVMFSTPVSSAKRLPIAGPSLLNRLAATIKTLQAKNINGRRSPVDDAPSSIKKQRLNTDFNTPEPSLQLIPAGQRPQLLAMDPSLLPGGFASAQPNPLAAYMQASAVESALSISKTGTLQRVSVPRSISWGVDTVHAKQGGVEAGVRRRLLLAAQALDAKSMGQYEDVCRQLKPFAKKRGVGLERLTQMLLHALSLRVKGTGFAYISKPLSYTVQELEMCRMWYFTATPFCVFAGIANVAMVFPKLIGKSHVHVVNIGETMIPQYPALLRLLAQQPVSRQGAPRGSSSHVTSAGALRSCRMTNINTVKLSRPGREDIQMMKGQGRVATVLGAAAEMLGVRFTFQGLDLDETNLSLLECIDRQPGEALVFISAYDLKFFSDDLTVGGGGRQQLLQCMRRLEPDIVCTVEENLSLSGGSFLSKFDEALEYYCRMFEVHDLVVDHDKKKWMYGFEHNYFGQLLRSVLACEGSEHRIRPQSKAEREKDFLNAGFKRNALGPKLFDAEYEMLQSYPEGFGLHEDGMSLALTWRGKPMFEAASWVLQ